MDVRYDNARQRGVRAWALIGCAIVFCLVIYALGMVWSAVELLLVGLCVGFICSPMTNWLDARGIPRAVAALLALVVVVLVLILVFLVLVPPFVSQLASVLQRVPSYVGQIRIWISDFWATFGNARTADTKQLLDQLVASFSTVGTKAASDLAEKLSGGLMSNLVGTANTAMTLFLGMVLGYWLAKDYPTIAHEVAVIAGPKHERSLFLLLAVLTRSVGGYMRATFITSLINGALVWVVLSALGNPYAGLLGATTFLMHFIPVVGPLISTAMAVLLSLFVSPLQAVEALLVCVVAQNVVDNVVSPLVMQSTVNVHPALSLVGIMVGSALGGVLGMVVAIPATAALTSVFVYYFEEKSKRRLVSFDGAFFRGQPFHNDDGSIDPVFDALGDLHFFERTRLVGPDFKEDAIADERPEEQKSVQSLAALFRRHKPEPSEEDDC